MSGFLINAEVRKAVLAPLCLALPMGQAVMHHKARIVTVPCGQTALADAEKHCRAEMGERHPFLADIFDGIGLSDDIRAGDKIHFNGDFQAVVRRAVFRGHPALVLL